LTTHHSWLSRRWAAAGFRVAGAAHRAFWRSCGARSRRLSCGRRSAQSLLAELHTEPPRGAAARVVAAWAAAGFRQSLLEAAVRVVAAWPLASVWQVVWAAAGLVWQLQSLLARVVAALSCGRRSTQILLAELRGWLSCGRGSTQSLLEELRCAWVPLACGWLCGARGRRWPAAGFRVAGALHRAFWRSRGARGRCWPAAGFRVAGALYTEPSGGAAARVAAADCGWLLCGRRSTQSLLEEVVRAWSPLACGCLSRGIGAVHRVYWRSC